MHRACRPTRSCEKGIARTFQNLRLFANLTVMENALIGQHARLKTGTVGCDPAPARHHGRGEAGARMGDGDLRASSATA